MIPALDAAHLSNRSNRRNDPVLVAVATNTETVVERSPMWPRLPCGVEFHGYAHYFGIPEHELDSLLG